MRMWMVAGIVAGVVGCAMEPGADEGPKRPVNGKSAALSPDCSGGPNGAQIWKTGIGSNHQSVSFEGSCFSEGSPVWVYLISEEKCSLFPDGLIEAMPVWPGSDDGDPPGHISGTFDGVCACEGRAFLWAADFDLWIDATSEHFGFCAL